MTEFLVKHFVKDYEKTEKVSVRTAYGTLASTVGIFCNVLLFLMKITIGIMIHSISVIADAFNNLSDAGSSIISFIGVKIASKPSVWTWKDGVHCGIDRCIFSASGWIYFF